MNVISVGIMGYVGNQLCHEIRRKQLLKTQATHKDTEFLFWLGLRFTLYTIENCVRLDHVFNIGFRQNQTHTI